MSRFDFKQTTKPHGTAAERTTAECLLRKVKGVADASRAAAAGAKRPETSQCAIWDSLHFEHGTDERTKAIAAEMVARYLESWVVPLADALSASLNGETTFDQREVLRTAIHF